jgi:hypothetical protein
MRLFGKPKPAEHEPGSVWEGPATYTTDPHIGRAGYYALTDDGTTILEPHVMLTYVDEAPRDEEDGSGHYEVADPNEPYFSHCPMALNPNVVPLEAQATTTSSVSVGGDDDE